MAAEKETVEPVAQEQTIHVHDASGDEHIQPKPIAISTPAMVLEALISILKGGYSHKTKALDPPLLHKWPPLF